MLDATDSLDLATLRARYLARELQPAALIDGILARIETRAKHNEWIRVAPAPWIRAQADRLDRRRVEDLPLFGIPFAVKDNLDVAGLPTTAACPAFEREADLTAPAVQRLLEAGALLIGKTNLDQFATGLVGTRSPYGEARNPFHLDYIAGGSSSGSAIAVATGQVSFALGTDTAGSGRVPAAFNNIVGLKPSRGLVSTRGLIPACRSLDCVSVLALTCDDAGRVLQACAGFDAEDPFSRAAPGTAPREWGRIGIPREDQLETYGDRHTAGLFAATVDQLRRSGRDCVTVDLSPFLEAAQLLYDGPWVAERYLAILADGRVEASALLPVTRAIVERGAGLSAVETFRAYYRLRVLRQAIAPLWEQIDALLTPTAATIYRLDEVAADPIGCNGRLGHYTNFVNLLDLCALAVPAGMRPDGLPFGVTLSAPAFREPLLARIGDRIHRAGVETAGAMPLALPPAATRADDGVRAPSRARVAHDETSGTLSLAVCGAHMSGLPLNHELTERGAWLVGPVRTSPRYRLFALEAFDPPRPGLVQAERGRAIAAELWELPLATVGSFLSGIPGPLAIGTVELDDGRRVKGFVCEEHATREARDITGLGGWRAYVEGSRA